jgi:hypothetical protein
VGIEFLSLPTWIGTPLQGVSAVGIIGILTILSRVYLGKGDLSVRAQEVRIQAGKVEAEIEAKLREHFSGELDRLTNEITRVTSDHDATRERQTQCEQREERLRSRVRKLEADYDGVLKIISLNSSVLLVGDDGRPSSEAVKQAAIRVIERLARGDPVPETPEGKP